MYRLGAGSDGVCAAVVHLEEDLGGVEVGDELSDVADISAAEGVDALVRVADDEDRGALGVDGQQFHDLVLHRVRVLAPRAEAAAAAAAAASVRMVGERVSWDV
eukprot:3700451-Rhodomonas_salina.1